MALELKAKVVLVNPEIQGQGRNGVWRKQEVIVETGGQYSKKVCLSIWGDKIDQFALQTGSEYTFAIDVESREYNGRWYTDVKAYDLKTGEQGASSTPKMQGQAAADPNWNAKSKAIKASDDMDFSANDDELPF